MTTRFAFIRLGVLLVLLALTLGCVGRKKLMGSPLVNKELGFARVYYGTNRQRTPECEDVARTNRDAKSDCKPNSFYGSASYNPPGARTIAAGGQVETGLEVGTLTVSFPPGHEVGKIERPTDLFVVEPRDEDPSKHVVITRLDSSSNDYKAWVEKVKSLRRQQALIYVHGYATSFEDAARRAAQIAYDLDFDLGGREGFSGIPMFYSWPSLGSSSPTAYALDRDKSIESIEAFNQFLDLVKKEAGVQRVHVIAHSMGNRVVAEALYARHQCVQEPEKIVDELVLAAPDIWAQRFKNHFLSTLPNLANRVTLYVSDRDKALGGSSKLRQGQPRAGQVAGGLLALTEDVDRFDGINASVVKRDFLGHSYYANSDSMISDIYCLLKGIGIGNRPLVQPAKSAYEFRPNGEPMNWNSIDCTLGVP